MVNFFRIQQCKVYWFKSKCLYGAPLLGLAQNNPPLGQTQQQTQHYVASKNTIENRSHIILHVSPINIKLIKVRQKMEDETCLKITLCMNKHLHSNGKLLKSSGLPSRAWKMKQSFMASKYLLVWTPLFILNFNYIFIRLIWEMQSRRSFIVNRHIKFSCTFRNGLTTVSCMH